MRHFALAVLALITAACSGGGSSPIPTQPAAPSPTPSPVTALALTGHGCVDGLCSGQVGNTVQLVATATLSDGTKQDVTAQAQWSSTNPGLATVSGAGLVGFLAAGDAEIVATYQGQSARGTIRSVACGFVPEGVAAFNAVGGTASITVATGPGCRWSVVTGDPWIRIDGKGPMTGPMAVALSVDPNRGFNGRSGTIVVKGDTGDALATYAVSQRAASCLYSIDPAAATLSWEGTYDGAGDFPIRVRVHTEPAGCQWTATSSVPWIRIVYDSARGSGDSIIYLSLIQWNSGPARTGDVTVAGLSGLNPDARVVVTQKGS
jgi:Bacterial Ig-like domain (group 2)/Putative binding domain, N-terminal